MPIYEYRCQGCGAVVEVFGQTAAQAGPPEECRCGETGSFARLYSSFAAHGGGSHGEGHDCCDGAGACETPRSVGCCGGGHCTHGH